MAALLHLGAFRLSCSCETHRYLAVVLLSCGQRWLQALYSEKMDFLDHVNPL